MQYAYCTEDGKTWEANLFAALQPDQLEIKRKSLVCVECKEFAWFRKESTHGRPSHFCAHHAENCSLKVEYVVVDDPLKQGTETADQVKNGDSIVVRLDQEQGQEVDVAQVQPSSNSGSDIGGKVFVRPHTGAESAQHFTMRRILHRLVQSPSFRLSKQEIALYRSETDVLVKGPVQSVVCNFANITLPATDNMQLFWGPIASVGRTQDGRVWLNSSSNHQSTSVAIFEDTVDDFLSSFKITNLEDLVGAHVLVVGKVWTATTGKPVIWCGSSKYIVLRRYKDENLQAVQ
ncbi:hypothetical protein ABHF33_11920 [Chitinibacter sp. FCG-7]|uniref:Uncharacterized protein n=1 Tax=Chitinibacter mangrovi TaxID=3153927 RepID=A0AAU7F7F3_9NEIS